MTTNTDLSAALAAAFPDAALKAERVREATRQWNEALAKAKELIATAAAALGEAEKAAEETGVLSIRGFGARLDDRGERILTYLGQCAEVSMVEFRGSI